MTKITYLDHSGFMVKSDKVIMVFDYFRDPAHKVVKTLDKYPDMPVVFFVSHYSPEHFNHVIFNLGQSHERAYVISNEVHSQEVQSDLAVSWMSHGDITENLPGGLKVRAYGIHGQGVSYLVTTPDGKTFFHGGGLCVDTRKKTVDSEDIKKHDEQYRIIVNQIAEDNATVDVAFMPVDIEDGPDFAQGATYFLEKVNVGMFFPFHVDDPDAKACDFKQYPFTKQVNTQLLCLVKPGESMEI